MSARAVVRAIFIPWILLCQVHYFLEAFTRGGALYGFHYNASLWGFGWMSVFVVTVVAYANHRKVDRPLLIRRGLLVLLLISLSAGHLNGSFGGWGEEMAEDISRPLPPYPYWKMFSIQLVIDILLMGAFWWFDHALGQRAPESILGHYPRAEMLPDAFQVPRREHSRVTNPTGEIDAVLELDGDGIDLVFVPSGALLPGYQAAASFRAVDQLQVSWRDGRTVAVSGNFDPANCDLGRATLLGDEVLVKATVLPHWNR